MSRRFAVILHHGLGDVICALPALWAVDKALRGAVQFDLVVKSELEAGVLESVPWRGQVRVHTLRAAEGSSALLRMTRALISLRRTRPEVFATPHVSSPRVAHLLADLVAAPLSVVTGSAGGTRRRGVERILGEHKAQEYARYFQAAEVPIDIEALEFPPLPSAILASRTEDDASIVIAPTVGAPAEQHKRWPESAFVDLVNQIALKMPCASIELFAGPHERPVLERICSALVPLAQAKVVMTMPTTPVEAVRALRRANCVVTSCSGASHLAAWAGVPIVGIYGPTNPGYTGPFSRQLRVVRKGWACSPCYRPGFISGCGTPVCMTEIKPQDVFNAVVATLKHEATTGAPVLATTRAMSPDRRQTLPRTSTSIAGSR